MTDNHHAPWRFLKSEAGGSLNPTIFKEDIFNKLLGLYPENNLRLVLSVCDLDFLENYIDRIFSYEKSPISIPMAIGVYSPIQNAEEISNKLKAFKKHNSLKKVHFLFFIVKN